MYDLLIVGAGLFGSIIARKALDKRKSVLVIEKRDHIGGNCYTKCVDDINVHVYGAHIFRTNETDVWEYMERFCEFNNFVNSPIANYNGELYNLPFNMNTFYQLWGVTTPAAARAHIDAARMPNDDPQNLEEHVLTLVGPDVYNKLVKGYTEKQWGRPCVELPVSIMRRIPLRFTFDNNYFNARYQGIPIGGYTSIFEKLLQGADVRLEVDYLDDRKEWDCQAKTVVYTGPIDAFFDFCFGPLEYRSLRFEHKKMSMTNYQGVAVMNFTDSITPYTRIIEHKHFEFLSGDTTIISYEYPQEWTLGMDPYYPMEDQINASRYRRYADLAKECSIHFGGRLGEYKYYDMQDTIKSAFSKAKEWDI